MSYHTRDERLNTGWPRDEELLQRVPLGEQIKELVIDTIMSGELQPGERVVAKTLAARLGVSQAPVREAIRDLILLGFLENVPYKGTSVRSFTTKELRDVYA
ncbi:MAG: GntR family transcriptional regulator, partial [Planctomycetaceae bacterium]